MIGCSHYPGTNTVCPLAMKESVRVSAAHSDKACSSYRGILQGRFEDGKTAVSSDADGWKGDCASLAGRDSRVELKGG